MKKITFVALFLMFAGITSSYAQADAASLMKKYEKVKGQYDGLVAKWKPYKDMAIQHSDKLNPELKTKMQDLDGQISSFGTKLDQFPNGSVDQQATMVSSLNTDYAALKKSSGEVIGEIKKLKLPKV
jgi:hypothetical protein